MDAVGLLLESLEAPQRGSRTSALQWASCSVSGCAALVPGAWTLCPSARCGACVLKARGGARTTARARAVHVSCFPGFAVNAELLQRGRLRRPPERTERELRVGRRRPPPEFLHGT